MAGEKKAHIIVITGDKAKIGATSLAVNLGTAMTALGLRVGVVDLDTNNHDLAEFIMQRKQANPTIPSPTFYHVSNAGDIAVDLQKFQDKNDIIIIDTPPDIITGPSNGLMFADTLITLVNDYTNLVEVEGVQEEGEDIKIARPALFSETIWQQKMNRVELDGASIDWLIIHNKMPSLLGKVEQETEMVLQQLPSRIGCRYADGFVDNTTLFTFLSDKKRTLIDPLDNMILGSGFILDIILAKQTLRRLLKTLKIPAVDERLCQKQNLEKPIA